MAETVYKSVPDLDPLPSSLDGSETLPIVKAGKTYRRSWATFFGSGWAANLLQAFTAFKSPDSVHADDADTVEGQDTATLHNAALLTGNIHLDRIPAELTGKNAATATLAANATKLATARTIGGVSFDGTANINLPGVNTAGNQNTSGNAATATDSSSLGGSPAASFPKNNGFSSGGAGNNIVQASVLELSTTSKDWMTIRTIRAPISGTIRFVHDVGASSSTYVGARILKEGDVLFEDTRTAAGYQTFTHDFSYSCNERIDVQLKNYPNDSERIAYSRNVYIKTAADIPFARFLVNLFE